MLWFLVVLCSDQARNGNLFLKCLSRFRCDYISALSQYCGDFFVHNFPVHINDHHSCFQKIIHSHIHYFVIIFWCNRTLQAWPNPFKEQKLTEININRRIYNLIDNIIFFTILIFYLDFYWYFQFYFRLCLHLIWLIYYLICQMSNHFKFSGNGNAVFDTLVLNVTIVKVSRQL